MNNLPLDIENIVNDYKYQLEHKDKFRRCLDYIDSFIHTTGTPYYSPDGVWIQLRDEGGEFITNFEICSYCNDYTDPFAQEKEWGYDIKHTIRIECRC